ncbi:hypothetical protein DH2020_018424 [Rehmannia glutinosa]|uniref:RNase H type-1 domain-containing protein n=1 Tax=Rehmannia glutinosa TaxID=99300 RepID=A0ABR0WIZ1_REHGL
MMIMVIWAIWKNRNETVWNGVCKSAVELLNSASSMPLQWESTQVVEMKGWRVKPGDGAIVWNKPKNGVLKCNVDGAIYHQESKVGFGIVLRDSHGSFVAARRKITPGIADPSLVEAMGVREALSWIKERFHDKVIILESDSLSVIQVIRAFSSSSSYFRDTIDDCLSLLNDLPLVSCMFTRRSANQVAHAIAKATDSISGVVVWEGIPPY